MTSDVPIGVLEAMLMQKQSSFGLGHCGFLRPSRTRIRQIDNAGKDFQIPLEVAFPGGMAPSSIGVSCKYNFTVRCWRCHSTRVTTFGAV